MKLKFQSLANESNSGQPHVLKEAIAPQVAEIEVWRMLALHLESSWFIIVRPQRISVGFSFRKSLWPRHRGFEGIHRSTLLEAYVESQESRLLLHTANGNGICSKLSSRQLDIAELAAYGYSNRDIAFELKTTEQIVKNVLHSVFDKLGIWNRVELANRFPRNVQPRNATERERRLESERSRQFPQSETFDAYAKSDPFSNQFEKPAESGMELRDLLLDSEFPLRKKRRRQGLCTAAEAYRSVARVFAGNPDVILQRVVDAATTFCGADSAGISLEEKDAGGPQKFRWIAISGSFAPFLGGTTPRFFSPCGTTLDRGRVQLYRVGKTYYDYLGIKADPITDGILMPWQAGEMRGTIWVVSHRHRQAFDLADLKLIDGVAEFAAMAVENASINERRKNEKKYPAA